MKIERFDVVLDRHIDDPYYGGQKVMGQIEVHALRRVTVGGLHVRLSGVAETGWRNKNSDVPFESRQSVLDEPLDLTMIIADHCNDNFELHEGMHSIPFEIQLPLGVLSSIDKENLGSVRYMCTAVLDLPEDGHSELIAEKAFQVFSLLNLDAPYLREPASDSEHDEIRGCCGFGSGSLSATMTIAEMGLLPGEVTRITLTVENKAKSKRFRRKREEHECVLISLCQQIDFVSTNRYDSSLVDRKSLTVAIESHGTCKARPGNGPETKEIEFVIPKGIPPTSIQADGLITCSYFFKLDMDHFDVIVPVVVGTVKSARSY